MTQFNKCTKNAGYKYIFINYRGQGCRWNLYNFIIPKKSLINSCFFPSDLFAYESYRLLLNNAHLFHLFSLKKLKCTMTRIFLIDVP